MSFILAPAASAAGVTTFEITFDGYTGAVEALVVDTNQLTHVGGTVVTAEVVTVQEGTEPLEGDFTLSFQGQETPALSIAAPADEVRCHVLAKALFEASQPSLRLYRGCFDAAVAQGIGVLVGSNVKE